MPASGSSSGERNVPSGGGGSVTVGVSHEIVARPELGDPPRLRGGASARPRRTRDRRSGGRARRAPRSGARPRAARSGGRSARAASSRSVGDADDPDREEPRHPLGIVERRRSRRARRDDRGTARSFAAWSTAATQSGCDSTSPASGEMWRVAKPMLQRARRRRRARRGTASAAAARQYGSPGMQAGEHVEDRGGVAHRCARRRSSLTRPPLPSPRSGPSETPPATRLQPEQAAAARRDADRAAAVVGVRDRDHAGRQPRTRSHRSSRRWCAWCRTGCVLGGQAGGSADGRMPSSEVLVLPTMTKPGAPERGDEVAVVRGAIVGAAEREQARGLEHAGDGGGDVLDQDRDAAERAVRRLVGAGARASS